MVPTTVPGRTIGVHACPECSVRVLPVTNEVKHRVYQTTGTSPEARQLHGGGRDWRLRHVAYEG